MSVVAAPQPFHKDHPYPARLTANRVLNKAGSAKETRHIVIDLGASGLRYKAGDSVGVFPSNHEPLVDEVLGLLRHPADTPVRLPKEADPLPLRTALLRKLSLAGPTTRMLELLAACATESSDRERLAALLRPEAKEATRAYLEEREVVDLLTEFPSARPDAQAFVDHLRRLAPRLYSIASSPVVHPTEVHTTVAVVRYETNGRARLGVCSTFLSDRARLGEPDVPVFIAPSHFALPEDPARDIIMVGPGTGIAPFRAFLQERAARGAPGRNWLFFGDQRRACDYLYEEEWVDFAARGHLARLDLAFSRDQETKVYVQDRMRESAAELWRWLQGGASFYVCGDAKRMAKDVDAALHEIVAREGGMGPEQAAAYVQGLKKEKRYQRDVY